MPKLCDRNSSTAFMMLFITAAALWWRRRAFSALMIATRGRRLLFSPRGRTTIWWWRRRRWHYFNWVISSCISIPQYNTAFFRILRIPVEFNSYRKIILIAPKLGSCRENFFQIHIRKPRHHVDIHTTIRGERVIFTCV